MLAVENTVCVILAGGRGKRMASSECHKVCFPIAGRPAIVRAIDTYKQAGLQRFLLVVGQMAEQVLATVSEAHPEVTFVYQTEPRGTGHAALVAAEALAAQGYRGPVLITMGDKVTRPEVVRRLCDQFASEKCDMLMATLPKTAETTAGRVVIGDDGAVLGIVELADIRRARAMAGMVPLGGHEFTAAEVEARSASVNVSLYLYNFGMLREALRHLSPSNAQGELYLTDTAEHIVNVGKVRTMLVGDPRDLMAYNTPAELLAIEEVIQAREGVPHVDIDPEKALGTKALKPVMTWLKLLEDPPPALQDVLRRTYGSNAAVIDERRRAMLRLVQAFAGQYGPNRKAIVCRAPGRINLMGRHVDHRGGYVNVMAINREVLVVAGPRDDDVVRLAHLNAQQFPNREFRIFDLLKEASWSDWMNFLASSTVRRVLNAAPGDWSHYVRAPLLRLQYEDRHARLKGMDCMVSGNIPMGAGLSSSSALVVAFAEAAVALNGLDIATRDFVDLCGEGEWFVGSRGGSADHAAIRTGTLGNVSRIGFFPFRSEGEIRFPEGHSVVIAHSGAAAVKSVGARDIFNQRVACYEFAEMLLRTRWPAAAGMAHLRDLTPDRLQIEAADIYHALTMLPDRPSRRALREMVPKQFEERVETLFATHANQGAYDLRGVALFGISECVRSQVFADALAAGDMTRVGQFMQASHDGDRVVRHDQAGKPKRHAPSHTDKALLRLAAANADVSGRCGRYACSTEAIDQLVDVATAVPGVVGAQLAGAGLGGCMMILVQTAALEPLVEKLRKAFYAPRDLEMDIQVGAPVEGAGLLSVDG